MTNKDGKEESVPEKENEDPGLSQPIPARTRAVGSLPILGHKICIVRD